MAKKIYIGIDKKLQKALEKAALNYLKLVRKFCKYQLKTPDAPEQFRSTGRCAILNVACMISYDRYNVVSIKSGEYLLNCEFDPALQDFTFTWYKNGVQIV